MNVIQCYAPSNGRDEEPMTNPTTGHKKSWTTLRIGDVNILMGDFNAKGEKRGSDGSTLMTEMNENVKLGLPGPGRPGLDR